MSNPTTQKSARELLFDAMREDEEMREARPTHIEKLRHDLDLNPQDPLPHDHSEKHNR